MKDSLNEVQEQWLESFVVIYKQASPIISDVTKLDAGQPASPDIFFKAYDSLHPLLQSLKDMAEPPNKDLRNIKKDFEKTLSMCVKAAEMMIKMIDDLNHGSKTAARMHFASVVGYVGYAGIYNKDLLDRLKKVGL